MKVYLSKINGLHTNASIEQVDLDLLGDKLKYFFRLSKALSAKGNLLQCGLQNKCKAFEKIISNEICKVFRSKSEILGNQLPSTARTRNF